MARVWMSGVEWNTLYESTFQGEYLAGTTTKRFAGTYGLALGPNDGQEKVFQQTLPSAISEGYIRGCLLLSSLFYSYQFITWKKDLTTLGYIRFNTTSQKLEIWVGGSLKATSTITLLLNRWYVIRVRVKIATDPLGEVRLRVNGVDGTSDDLTWTGGTSGIASTFNQVAFAVRTVSNDAWMDNFAINDTDGAYNNSWPDHRGRILLLRPNGVGTYTDWTPTGDTPNWKCVDDVTPDLGSTYNYTNAVGDKDSYNIENLPPSDSVVAVQLDSWPYRSRLATPQNIKPLVLAGSPFNPAAIYYGDDYQPGFNYILPTHTVWDVNPVTSAPWEQEEIDYAEIGAESAA